MSFRPQRGRRRLGEKENTRLTKMPRGQVLGEKWVSVKAVMVSVPGGRRVVELMYCGEEAVRGCLKGLRGRAARGKGGGGGEAGVAEGP